ncbi:transmembrane transport protein [Liquorilactobacillus sucicola DSM 21376 = JCM 15457]|uniref:Putative proline/betaine transporter n=1 Tax=Liquorilactobacillus sucicola DSM 21376 = JCM 15457 TaxID=1423806 RepID=A0A023CYQ3_9LACO|nr:MFS transporter [Liquorilactobacillus sucicola]KRN07678.1 transport protein [Liquorilactobacillus sucicola DSM 21376 = JCM 15457]GAJ26686.1 transmembrane transport protein [Liquorilactobacillus sucicola DSM 21376 = JCM 15457]
MDNTDSLSQDFQNSKGLKRDSVKTVMFASMVGTAIEFFDFYAYGTAAAAYFPKVFFPEVTPAIATILSLLTFGVAFIARPLGSFVFGHFGDKIGRKRTLVVSLLLMGISTVLIGLLPSYSTLGLMAVILLCACRFVQGIGLGGEWSGAALVATENAPANKRALYGAFPELGAPLGFFLSNGLFFLLESFLTPAQMLSFGWRVPFLASSVLVLVGFWVRERMQETPLFRLAQEKNEVTKSPLKVVFKTSWRQIIQGTFIVSVTYTLFYTLATWSLTYATTKLGFTNQEYLFMLMGSIIVFAALIVLSSRLADTWGRRRTLMVSSTALIVFAFLFPYLLQGQRNFVSVSLFLIIGFVLMGIAFGPVGALLPELFSTKVRYSGSGIAYNLAAIVGAAFAPTIATWLAENWGIRSVGIYLAVMAVACLVSLITIKETKSVDFSK